MESAKQRPTPTHRPEVRPVSLSCSLDGCNLVGSSRTSIAAEGRVGSGPGDLHQGVSYMVESSGLRPCGGGECDKPKPLPTLLASASFLILVMVIAPSLSA